jgi:hypothetical protein
LAGVKVEIGPDFARWPNSPAGLQQPLAQGRGRALEFG